MIFWVSCGWCGGLDWWLVYDYAFAGFGDLVVILVLIVVLVWVRVVFCLY